MRLFGDRSAKAFVLSVLLVASGTRPAVCDQLQGPPFSLGDYILDSPLYEEGKEFLYRPKAIRQKYEEDANNKILRHLRALKEGQLRGMDNVTIEITVSRSGNILNIKEVRGDGRNATPKAFSPTIEAIKSIELDPVPDNYLEDDLTFNFHPAPLNAELSDVTTDYAWKDSKTDPTISKISSQLWWSALPAVPTHPLFGPGPEASESTEIDSSPAMKAAWNSWRQRLNAEIHKRVERFAKAAFHNSPRLKCELTYTVTKDGRIKDISVKKSSANVLFNVLIQQAVQSLDGNASLLQFPSGSNAQKIQETFVGEAGAGQWRNRGDLLRREEVPWAR